MAAATAISDFLFRLVLVDVAVVNETESLGQAVWAPSSVVCGHHCMQHPQCQAFFYAKNTSGGLCTPAYKQFSQMIGSTFQAEPGQNLYRLETDFCSWSDSYTWDRNSQLCFRLSSIKANFDDSIRSCEQEGSRLAFLNTESKYRVLYNIFKMSKFANRSFFIGARGVTNTSVWRWLDGTEVTYYEWGENEPSSIAEECIGLYSNQDHRFNDFYCSYETFFVCEKVPPSDHISI